MLDHVGAKWYAMENRKHAGAEGESSSRDHGRIRLADENTGMNKELS